jgi:phenylpyruvate tautomerase PptA (4-oxalocrotonate tautomerase family)
VPSLQLDFPGTLDETASRALARRLGSDYAEIMGVEPHIVTVVVRGLGPGTIWRCTSEEPVSAVLLMCDIRRGRPVETRAGLARALVGDVVEALGVPPEAVKVEFTQHGGDDMFHPHLGGFNRDWTADER